MTHLAVVALFGLVAVTVCAPHKILVYNLKFAHSHVNFMGSLADRLVEAGHNVTTLMPEVIPSMSDGTFKSRIIRIPPAERVAEYQHEVFGGSGGILFDTDAVTLPMAAHDGYYLGKMSYLQCKKTLNTPHLLEQLKNEHYDLLITENVDYCGIGIAHVIGAKATISVSTTILWEADAVALGVPLEQSYNPSFFTSELDGHSMYQRAINLFSYFKMRLYFDLIRFDCQRAFYEEYGPDFPNLQKLIGDSAFAFTNSEPLTDMARPTLAKVVQLGGLSVKQPKPLDKNWLDILSRRPRTVLVSFGSLAKSITMKEHLRASLLKAMSRFPEVTFVWKYESPDDSFSLTNISKVENVVTSKWMPQSDLLNDERVVGFISHAGMGSCQEAAARGVPGVYIPLFGDQRRNALAMSRVGLGIVFDKFDLGDTDKVTAAVKRLLEDTKLRDTARLISRKLAKRPFSPSELLLKYVEFAAEFGGSDNLTPAGLALNPIEYYNVDIFAIAALAILVILYVFAKLLYYAITKIPQIIIIKKKID